MSKYPDLPNSQQSYFPALFEKFFLDLWGLTAPKPPWADGERDLGTKKRYLLNMVAR